MLRTACATGSTGFRRAPLFGEAAAAPRSANLSRRHLLTACACCVAAGVLGPRLAQAGIAPAPTNALHAKLDFAATAIEARMIGWRRDVHQNPELGNQEVRTSGRAAEHLRRLGYEVRDRV